MYLRIQHQNSEWSGLHYYDVFIEVLIFQMMEYWTHLRTTEKPEERKLWLYSFNNFNSLKCF